MGNESNQEESMVDEQLQDELSETEFDEAEAQAAEEITAERVAELSDVVANLGVHDMAQIADILTMSEDSEAMGAIVGLMSADDLERGLELARMAGELWAVSDVVSLLDMPVLADVLESRGEHLQRIAVETIVRFSSASALSEVMAGTNAQVGQRDEEELAEDVARAMTAAAVAAESETLAELEN